ncbi:hypothetical protein [Streptomyces sp. NPDC055400]
MNELPPESQELEPADEGNVALPVPVDSPAATSGDGASPSETLPPALPA